MSSVVPFSKGLIWRSAWEAPGEGPFSLAAKAANANQLQYSIVRDWVFAKDQTTARLGNSALRSILCSSRVRYCRVCMASCYHASLFQFWHIKNCPIHNQPLRTTCASCQTPTALFPFDRLVKTSVNLRCPRCTEPYGFGKSGLSPSGWHAVDGVETISSLLTELQWIRDAIPSAVRLVNQSTWRLTKSTAEGGKEEEALRGSALFWILERLYGPSQGSQDFEVELFFANSVNFQVTAPAPFLQPATGDLVCRLKANLVIEDFSEEIIRPSFGAAVPMSSSVPAWVHAISLWRVQHESFPDAPTWADIVDNRFQADWLAASRIATEWHQVLLALEAESGQSARMAALLTTEERWYRRLGRWINLGYSPVLHIADGMQDVWAVF